jgi:hypothetical protein
MIDNMYKIPKFSIDIDDAMLIADTSEFHDNIIEFIEKNIRGEINEIVLCHFIAKDGTVMVAKLPKKAYKQAVIRSIDFYVEEEQYEKCNNVKQLLEKL